jgi:hypothetical protein
LLLSRLTKEHSNEKSSPKKTTVNLFLDSNILEDIRKEAENENISLNAKINTILTDYSLLHKYSHEQDAVYVTGRSFQFMLNNIDENKFIDEYKAVTTDLATSMLIERNVSFTLDNVIKYIIEGVAKRSGSFRKFTRFKNKEGHTCLLFRHNHGAKWSKIFGTGMSKLLEHLLKCHTAQTLLPSSVLIKISEKDIQ